jgi:hypothetical protein
LLQVKNARVECVELTHHIRDEDQCLRMDLTHATLATLKSLVSVEASRRTLLTGPTLKLRMREDMANSSWVEDPSALRQSVADLD